MQTNSTNVSGATEHQDILVLGGGLAGLSASMESGGAVYEAADRLGGVGSSDTVEGFTFDRGIHVLNTKSPKFLAFLKDIGVELAVVNRIAHIYSQNRYTAYPFQVNTAGMALGLRARCVAGYLRRGQHPEPTNYREWMYSTIGSGFADNFLIPYSEKFWGIDPAEMTFEWTGTKVPKTSMWHVLRGAVWSRQTAVGSNAVFHYPKNGRGYGTIGEAIARRAGESFTDHRAVELDIERRIVTFANGRRVSYGVLVSTIPTPTLINMIAQRNDAAIEAAQRLRANAIMVVNLGIDRAGISEKHWVHCPEKQYSFFRLSFPHNFNPNTVPAGTSSVSCEVSYPPGSPPDRDEIIERVRRDLVRTGILRDDDRVLVSHTHDIPSAYCIYDRHRKGAVRMLRDWLEPFDIILGGRFGLWTYFWSDEAINSGRQSGRKAQRRLEELNVARATAGQGA